ncbi:hypothetical protein Tco_0938708 [Tanacetum coccineum]|uniref:Uncharacterized protein n=1 Tax=Tanacetum coccineum TaxID=301880 RepID=A0ABQ5DIY1_9ASTR
MGEGWYPPGRIIMDYLVNISKRRAFWSLNEDILKITILTTNTPYPSRKIRHYYSEDQYAVSIKEDTAYPCLHSPKTTENKAQYVVSRETQYAVFKIWKEYNILEDIKRGPYSKKSPIRLRMTKVIKREFEKIKDVKVEDVSLTYDKPLEVFNNEVSRLSGMDDDLFTYEVEVANIPCDSKMDDDSEQEADDDMGGDDEVELIDEESSDDEDNDLRPMKITRMIGSINGTRTYHGSMRSHGLTPEFGPNPHQLNILTSLSTIRLGVRNGQHVVGRTMDTDYEWYEALEDCKLKNEALRNKAIMKGFIKDDDDESHSKQMKRWNIYANYDDAYEINHEKRQNYVKFVSRRCLVGVVLLVKDCRMINHSKRRAFWSLNEDILKITILKTNTPYPSRKIQRIRAATHQRPQRIKLNTPIRESYDAVFKIWNEYNILEDIKCGPYSKKSPIRRDLDNSTSNVLIPLDSWTSGLLVYELSIKRCYLKTLSYEPTVSSLNDEIDFRIPFDDSDNEDYTVIFDKNSFSYKIISTNDLKTDSKNDNEKVNMPSLPPPELTVSCFDDLDFFNDFENEFPAIVYNDAQMSKSDLLTEPILSPQHIVEFDLYDETSLFEYDKEEQNVLYFNDLFPFNIIHPNDLKLEKDNDDNEVDIIQSSRGNEITRGIAVIMEYLVSSRKRGIMVLNEDYFEDYYSDKPIDVITRKILVLCMHSPPPSKDHKGKTCQYAISSEDQYAVLET